MRKRERETLKGDPKRRKEPAKDPMAESMRKTKDRKDKSNEGDQDGRNERKLRKGAAKDTPQQRAVAKTLNKFF